MQKDIRVVTVVIRGVIVVIRVVIQCDECGKWRTI